MKPTYKYFLATLLALASPAFISQAGAPPTRQAAPAKAPAKKPAAQVDVLARKGGRIWEVYVRNGQHVQQGQTMFKIATQVRTAVHPGHQIDYDVAKQNYIKALSAHQAHKASAEEVAAAKFQMQTAARLLNDAPHEVQFHYVDAPISGTLSNVSADNQPQSTSVLVTITADPAPKPSLVATSK